MIFPKIYAVIQPTKYSTRWKNNISILLSSWCTRTVVLKYEVRRTSGALVNTADEDVLRTRNANDSTIVNDFVVPVPDE